MTFIKTIFLSLCILASTLMSSAQVKFSIDPRLGMTLSGGQLLKEYRGHQFQLPTSKSYDIQLDYSLGILANVGDRWASSFRVGKYGSGLGYRYWETSQSRSGYYIGFDLNYFKLHTEYTWSKLQFKNGILKHWGVNMQGEIALGYDYVPSVQVSDEPREYSMMRIGGRSYYRIERSIQTKRGQGSLSLGLNGQIL